MKMNEIKNELKRVANRVTEYYGVIIDDPRKIHLVLTETINTGFLTDDQLLELEDYMSELSDEHDEQDYIVEEHTGTYIDCFDLINYAHFIVAVASAELGDLYDYDNGVLSFQIPFYFTYTEYNDLAGGMFYLDETEYNAKMDGFVEMSEEEWNAYLSGEEEHESEYDCYDEKIGINGEDLCNHGKRDDYFEKWNDGWN